MFYKEICGNPDDKRMRIVQAAAYIIREDIYKQPTDTLEYIPAEMAFQDPLSVIPNSLSTLIERIISKRKRGLRKALDRKKVVHRYLHQMSVLEERMPASEYEYFTKKGSLTIRRWTHKMWAGIWSDMTIEQVLMHQMKVSGGLTHGQGMTDYATTQWLQAYLLVLS